MHIVYSSTNNNASLLTVFIQERNNLVTYFTLILNINFHISESGLALAELSSHKIFQKKIACPSWQHLAFTLNIPNQCHAVRSHAP